MSKQTTLFYLRKQKRALKKRIGQSMRDGGSFKTTTNCKNLQKKLSCIVKAEKHIKRRG